MRTFTFILLFFCTLSAFSQDHLYAWDTIQEVKIYFEQDNWQKILDHYKKEGDKKRLTGSVKINGTVYENVGIRYKGNSSYNNTQNDDEIKLPFNIKLTHEDSEQKTPQGYKTLKLANVFRDPSFVREILAYEIARKYMPAPKCNFAKVYINDEYWGLYSNTESIDKRFLKNYYKEKDGVLFKCDPESWNIETRPGCEEGGRATLNYLGDDLRCYEGYYELKSDDPAGWNDLITLTQTIEQKNVNLDSLLDVVQTLWMLAFNNVTVNLDSYTGLLCHNYYIYKTANGQFHPLVWDMNLAFGGFRMADEGGKLTNEEMQKMSPFLHYKNEKRPLIHQLLSDDLNRKIYLAQIKTIVEENFGNDWYKQRIETVQTLIDQAVQEDSHKLYPYRDFKANVDSTAQAGNAKIVGITELMDARTSYLLGHPLIEKESPTISEVTHEVVADSLITINAVAENVEQVWLFCKNNSKAIFQRVELDEKGNNQWTTQINYTPTLQYYIVAEAAKTATLMPKRAGMEYFDMSNQITTKNQLLETQEE